MAAAGVEAFDVISPCSFHVYITKKINSVTTPTTSDRLLTLLCLILALVLVRALVLVLLRVRFICSSS